MNLNFIFGFGSGLISREVFTGLQKVLRPAMKSVIKAGMVGYQKSAEGLGKLGESFEDIVAEAKNENSQQGENLSKGQDERMKGKEKEREREKEKEDRPKAGREGKQKMDQRTTHGEESSHADLH